MSRKILAISSAGGHWVQLRRLRQAWSKDCSVTYVTTKEEYKREVFNDVLNDTHNPPEFLTIVAANRWQKIRLLRQLLSIIWIVFTVRPDVVVSTGAAAGFFAIRVGKILGARTIWIDSIANVDQLSLSGQKVQKYADLWLTQWEGLANCEEGGPKFRGAVI